MSTSPSLRGHVPSLQRSLTFQAESPTCRSSRAPPLRPRYKSRHLFSSEASLSQLSGCGNESGGKASEDEDFVEAADLPLLSEKYGVLQGKQFSVVYIRA